MKQISDAFAARLTGDAMSLCLCWRLSRQDGLQVCVTDHDSAVTIDGETFAPGAALEGTIFVQSASLKPGHAAAGGVLSIDAITEADLLAGLWDGCRVDVFQVDWQAPEAGRRHIWCGLFSEVQLTESGAFEVELASLKAELERPIGRVIQRRCDATLGDARCGISAAGRTCDQRFETCRDVFSNSENFRGFPHLPGTDFVLSGPSDGVNDGGKR